MTQKTQLISIIKRQWKKSKILSRNCHLKFFIKRGH